MPSLVPGSLRRSGRIRRESSKRRAWKEANESEREDRRKRSRQERKNWQWEAAILRVEREMAQEEVQLDAAIRREELEIARLNREREANERRALQRENWQWEAAILSVEREMVQEEVQLDAAIRKKRVRNCKAQSGKRGK